jgi:uncharacterized membrane protein (TIGR02234 family)
VNDGAVKEPAAPSGAGGAGRSRTVEGRLTAKRTVLLTVLLAAVLLLVSASRTWVEGSVRDVVLGATALHGSGTQVAPGVLAAALVGAASAVAAATSGRVVRTVAAVATVLAAVLALVGAVGVLADPGSAVGRLAATSTGRTGTVGAQGRITFWVVAAVVAAVVMGLAGVAAVAGSRRWSGLSSRYDAPGDAGVSPEASAGRPSTAREESPWDQLTRGEDPTDPQQGNRP